MKAEDITTILKLYVTQYGDVTGCGTKAPPEELPGAKRPPVFLGSGCFGATDPRCVAGCRIRLLSELVGKGFLVARQCGDGRTYYGLNRAKKSDIRMHLQNAHSA